MYAEFLRKFHESFMDIFSFFFLTTLLPAAGRDTVGSVSTFFSMWRLVSIITEPDATTAPMSSLRLWPHASAPGAT
jgi:hypothetical protein